MAGKFDSALEKMGSKKYAIALVPEDRPRIGRPPGKRTNPAYERLTVLVTKARRKTAWRKWEDENPDQDMSELVEMLLGKYINGQLK